MIHLLLRMKRVVGGTANPQRQAAKEDQPHFLGVECWFHRTSAHSLLWSLMISASENQQNAESATLPGTCAKIYYIGQFALGRQGHTVTL